MPPRAKRVKCKYYHPETGDPNPRPCPSSSKVCWFIHPGEPEWDEIGAGGMSSSPPRKFGRGRRSLSPRRRGRSRSRSRSRSRGRGRSRSRSRSGDVRRRSRSRTKSGGRFVSPSRRRPRLSSPPPRRPLYDRIQRSNSPRPRSRSRSRSYPPRSRRPLDRRRPRTPTPVSSSRADSPPPPPPPKSTRPDPSPRAVKVEPPVEAVPKAPPITADSTLRDMNISALGDQPHVLRRVSTDRSHQEPPPSLNLSLGGHVPTSQPPSPQTDPLSPVFAPETPVIPGFSSSVQLAPPQLAAISALQKSLESVIRDRPTDPAMQPPTVSLSINPATSIPATIPEMEKTEIWTTRVKLWADMMKAKSEIMDWQDEVKVAQALKDRSGFDTFSTEAQDQVNLRISHATKNLVQHQLAFEAFVSQSIALDRSVSRANAALAPAPAEPDPRAAAPREIEWMQERIMAATARADELEKKLALQDQLLERVKAEQDAVAALAPFHPSARPGSPMEVDDGDGLLDGMPSLKRKRLDDDDPRPSSRRKSLARHVVDLREANEALVDRIAEAEGTIEGILNDVVEDPEDEELSRAARLKEILQDYQMFIENAKTAIGFTESNSRVVETLKTEAEKAVADWNEVYQEFEVVRNEAMEIHAREKERAEEIAKKEEQIALMQRQIEALNATVQAWVEQQSAQPEEALTLEQVIAALKPRLKFEMQEVTQPLLLHKHDELQRMLTEHIEAVRVSIYEPIALSEQVARTMVTWLEAEFGFGTKKR